MTPGDARTDYMIRLAREAELACLQAIELAAARLFDGTGVLPEGDAAPTPPVTLREGVHAGLLWVAADAADRPVGFALVRFVDAAPFLQEMDVHPDHGRRGLGTRLVHTVCDWARAAGYAHVTLTTQRNIPWNAPFYARLGFTVVAEAAYTPGLRAALDAEVAAGLDRATRVVMRRLC